MGPFLRLHGCPGLLEPRKGVSNIINAPLFLDNAGGNLRPLTAVSAGTNVTVTWQSVAGVNYFLERSTNLSATPPFPLLAPDLPGQPGTTTHTNTNAANLAPFFYCVGVGN